MQALASASLTFQLAKMCSRGESGCGCQTERSPPRYQLRKLAQEQANIHESRMSALSSDNQQPSSGPSSAPSIGANGYREQNGYSGWNQYGQPNSGRADHRQMLRGKRETRVRFLWQSCAEDAENLRFAEDLAKAFTDLRFNDRRNGIRPARSFIEHNMEAGRRVFFSGFFWFYYDH